MIVPVQHTKETFMKLHKSQSGFAHLVLVLLIAVVLGGVGFAGYKVYNTNKADESSTPSQSTTTDHADDGHPHESTIPAGFIEYENKELGFKFAYPSSWGEATFSEETTESEKGHRYNVLFSQEADASVGVLTKDWEWTGGGRDFLDGPAFGFTEFKPYELSNGSSTGFADRSIVDEPNIKVIETVNTGFSDSTVNLFGRVKFSKSKTIAGIQIDYTGEKQVDENMLDDYKVNPDKYLSAAERSDYVLVLRSVKEL
jgi:hypothetical protein